MGLTQDRLKELLHYNSDTGVFTRKTDVSNGAFKAGEIAGTKSFGGGRRYHVIRVEGETINAHRLAWFYVKGEFPSDQIDHINGDSFDNRMVNLRAVTIGENNKNKAIDKRNKSGVTGVHWSKKENSWKCQINVNKKRIHIGYFKDLADAALERLEAEFKHGFHKNHGRAKV